MCIQAQLCHRGRKSGSFFRTPTQTERTSISSLSVRYDHILKWELFQLADLDTYQGMLKLLFMKELEHIVKSYEAYRQALLSEVEARKQRQQWYAQQQPNKNFMGNM